MFIVGRSCDVRRIMIKPPPRDMRTGRPSRKRGAVQLCTAVQVLVLLLVRRCTAVASPVPYDTIWVMGGIGYALTRHSYRAVALVAANVNNKYRRSTCKLQLY